MASASGRPHVGQEVTTSLDNWLERFERSVAGDSTSAAAAPVSIPARLTPLMFAVTSAPPAPSVLHCRQGRRLLFLHRGGYGGGNRAHLLDRRGNVVDCRHGLARCGLDLADLLTDLQGCLGRLAGEVLHFGCHHRKAFARKGCNLRSKAAAAAGHSAICWRVAT
jgi:hypothetical protein